MKITKQNIEKIVNLLIQYHKKDIEIQDRYNQFNDIFASNSHSPVIENNLTKPIIDIFDLLFGKSFKEDLEYFLFEIPMFETDEVIVTCENNRYDFKKKEDFMEYLYFKYKLHI